MNAQTGIIAAPMTYAVSGEQYIAVLAGWGGAFALPPGELSFKSGHLPNISRVLVFKLGGGMSLPPAPEPTQQVLNPPASAADQATVDRGKAVYSRFCSTCHGDAAVSGGLVPDLRYSAFLGNDQWFDIVLGGALKDGGMASFRPVLSHDQVANIRAYVIARANQDKAPPPPVPGAAPGPPADGAPAANGGGTPLPAQPAANGGPQHTTPLTPPVPSARPAPSGPSGTRTENKPTPPVRQAAAAPKPAKPVVRRVVHAPVKPATPTVARSASPAPSQDPATEPPPVPPQ